MEKRRVNMDVKVKVFIISCLVYERSRSEKMGVKKKGGWGGWKGNEQELRNGPLYSGVFIYPPACPAQGPQGTHEPLQNPINQSFVNVIHLQAVQPARSQAPSSPVHPMGSSGTLLPWPVLTGSSSHISFDASICVLQFYCSHERYGR
jgi:hypothetical protein